MTNLEYLKTLTTAEQWAEYLCKSGTVGHFPYDDCDVCEHNTYAAWMCDKYHKDCHADAYKHWLNSERIEHPARIVNVNKM